MTFGIYLIKNKINDEPYVGQSKYVEKRWRQHKWKLNNNKHDNNHLQNAWNKYGSTAFEFSILKECGITDLNRLEKHYIQKFDAFNNGYNQTTGGEGISGYNHTDEWKKERSEAMMGENNPNYGKYGEKNPRAKYTIWDIEKVHYHKGDVFRNNPEGLNPRRCFQIRYKSKDIPIGSNLDFLTCELFMI